MKGKLNPTTTPEEKMEIFRSALRSVLKVSHDDMQGRLAKAEEIRRRTKRKPGPKPSASGHASDSET
jgi:hypothetical protein